MGHGQLVHHWHLVAKLNVRDMKREEHGECVRQACRFRDEILRRLGVIDKIASLGLVNAASPDEIKRAIERSNEE